MDSDNSPSKDAKELKELTHVLRSVDLKTEEPNDIQMTDAAGEIVFYHPNYSPHKGKVFPSTGKERIEITKEDLEEMVAHDMVEATEHGEPEGEEVIGKKDIKDEK